MSAEETTRTLKVRTKHAPTEEVEVSVAELIDLRRQGLIFEGTATEAKEAQEAGPSLDVVDPYNPDEAKAKTTTSKKGE